MPTPPPELEHLQALFYNAIATRDPASVEELSQHMHSNLSYEQGLSAYQGSQIGKFSRALEEIYPVCYQLVGSDFFGAMIRKYIRQHASRSPDIGDYGADLSAFIADFSSAASLPYLQDVARLEWHWHRVFNSPEHPRLDIEALGQVSPEDWGTLIFHLSPDSVLLSSDYPVHRIWQVHQPHQDDQEPINLDQGGVNMFIWRDQTETRIDLPTQEEWTFLLALSSGQPFEQVCQTCASATPAVNVAELLPRWVQRGWIVDFTVQGKAFKTFV